MTHETEDSALQLQRIGHSDGYLVTLGADLST